MKKHLTLWALFSLLLCVVLALAACGPDSPANVCATEGHLFSEAVEIKAATCTDAGFAEASCTRCGEKEQTEIPAIGHKEKTVAGTPATCTKDGTTDKVVCEYCDEVLTASTVIPKGHILGEVSAINKPSKTYANKVFFACEREECSYRFEYTLPKLTDTGYTTSQVGEDVTYSILIEGKTVSFTISNFDFAQKSSGSDYYYQLRSYSGNTANLTIPSTYEGLPVKEIGEGAFKNNTTLTTVVLPTGLESISASAFSGCTSLSSITVPEGCKIIDAEAFLGCTALTEVSLPAGLEYVYKKVFYGCSRLNTVNLPNSLCLIGESAFEGCTSLESATVGEATELRSRAFKDCTALQSFTFSGIFYGYAQLEGCTSLKTLTLGSLSKSLGYLFYGSFNSNYDSTADYVPASLKELTVTDTNDFYAISGCTNIEKVTIGSCKNILPSAFKNCSSLTTVILPDNLEKLPSDAFEGCTSLVTYTYESGKYLGNSANNYVALIGYTAPAAASTFTVKDGTRIISLGGSFWTDFTAYSIPISVKSITGYPRTAGFNISYSGTATEWMGIDFYSDDQPLTRYATVTFRDGTKNTDITTLELPDGTEHLQSYLFEGFGELTAVILPKSINTILYNVFRNTDVTTLYYKGEHADWYSIYNTNSYTLQDIEHIYFYNEAEDEYYEPTFIKFSIGDSTYNLNGFAALEVIVLDKSIKSYSATAFDSFTHCDLYYEGTEEEWAQVTNGDTLLSKFDVFFYSEAEQTLAGYLANPKNLWHYTASGAPVAWVATDNTVDSKTYSYTTTVVKVSDVYWAALKEAEAQGMLEALFGNDTISIEMVTSSSTKAEYEEKLINFARLTGADMSISFSSGKMNVKKDGMLILDYVEANGKIYAKAGNQYTEYARINGDTIVEDGSSDEYVTIEHIWTLTE
ncbi:MAG: leucine-rich repeat protein [Clostridia bacterium]|nr:leucine-rich repeat protein [Clostridia bacterium]